MSPTTGSFNAGTQVSITATPNSGYQFTSWSNGSTTNPVTVTLNSNTTITANFEVLINSYTLTVVSTDGGSATGAGEYNEGTEVTLTATASEGYRFTGWSDGSTEESITITLNSDTALTANFEVIPVYTLTVSTGEGGSVSTEGGDYEEGTEITITATPDEGYEFTGWSDGSTEESRVIIISEDINLTVSYERILFESKSERYSAINETTGYYKTQKFFERNLEVINFSNILDFYEGDIHFRVNTRESVFSDFDGDGLVDVFGFACAFLPDDSYCKTPGKFILQYDYITNLPENRFVFDSEISNPGSKMLLNDFDLDGVDEIYITSHNTKFNIYNQSEDIGGDINLPPLNPFIIDVQEYGIVNIHNVGVPMGSHGSASGDVNNDGLPDFIQVPIDYIIGDSNSRYPITFINNGSLNFENINSFGNSTMQNDYHTIYAYTIDLFDLDNDDNLDLIFGNFFGEPHSEPDDCCWNTGVNYAIVFWGDGTGNFYIENSSKLTESNYLSQGITIANRSFGFSDIDNDGDIDVIAGGTITGGSFATGGYYDTFDIITFINNGDRTFYDATDAFVDISSGSNSEYQTSYFYGIQSIDKDNDGDYDLVPNQLGSWELIQRIREIYWEKSNGSFDLNIID